MNQNSGKKHFVAFYLKLVASLIVGNECSTRLPVGPSNSYSELRVSIAHKFVKKSF